MDKLKKQNLKFKNEWTWVILAGLGILAIAFLLRAIHLLSIPIFVDEAIYIRWAQVMKAESTLRFLPLSDGKQPLFMWTVIPFLKVFNDPLIAGRMVSVLLGVGSVVGVFFLTLRLFSSKKLAFIASFLIAVSPFAVFFNRMALVDTMLTFFGIWGLYFAILTAQTRRLDFAMLTGFSLGFAWLTKSPAVFFLALVPTTALLVPWKGKKSQNLISAIHLLSLWIVAAVIAFGMYNIQRLGPNFHMIALRNHDYVFTFSEVLQRPLDLFQLHLMEIVQWLWVLLPGSILLLAVGGISIGFKKYWKEILVLGAWFLVPLLVQSEIAKVFTARYILYTLPPLFVMASLLFTHPKLKNKTAFLLVLLVAVLPALWIDQLLLFSPERVPLSRDERAGYLENWTAGTGIREVASFIKEEHTKNPDKQIVIGTEGFFGTLPDGLQIYVADTPRVVVKGVGIRISSVESSLIEAKKAGDKVYLVVNSTRFKGNPEDIGLTVVASYPKAQKPDGTRESLILFEVTDKSIDIYDINNLSIKNPGTKNQ